MIRELHFKEFESVKVFYLQMLPANRDERKECGAIMENLALSAETPNTS